MREERSSQDSSLAVMLRLNSQFEDTYYKNTEFMFCSDIYVAYLNEDIVKYREARDEIANDLTSAEDEASKNVRLQNKLLSLHGDFDVIGLIHFNWGHSTNKLPRMSESCRRSVTKATTRMPLSRRSTLSATCADTSASAGSVDLLNGVESTRQSCNAQLKSKGL